MPYFGRSVLFQPAHALRWLTVCAALGMALLTGRPVLAADDDTAPLRLGGLTPHGLRIYATESWGSFDFDLTNLTDIDRRARVVVFYQGRPDVEYGRDVWVPARSTLKTWMLVGPAVVEAPATMCEIEVLLYDHSDGTDRLIRPRGEERIRSRGEIYRKREPCTAILIDDREQKATPFGSLPEPDSPTEEAILLGRAFREAGKMSEQLHRITAGFLPTTAEAYDGVDHFVIVSNEIARNPAGIRALRHWLVNGGKLWVMLDVVDPEVLAPLLGEVLDFQLVDRVPLTAFRVESQTGLPAAGPGEAQQHDRSIQFARVLLPPDERARHTVNGWPAWFSRQVGRGKVIFTTLGPRGWYRDRDRKRGDRASPFSMFPESPVPRDPLVVVEEAIHPTAESDPFRAEALRPLLDPEIGYSVVGRGSVVLVFCGFLLAALALGIVLRRSRRPELVGWLGPAAALGAAGVFLALGESSRRAVPPTVAVAQVVHSIPGQNEAAIDGMLAVYRPDSGLAEIGAREGGFFELDMAGLAGQSRRFMLTDLDAWHWDNLALPAGVRFASFHGTAPTGEPITAVAHFGPEGIEGRLAAGPFRELADGLVNPANGRNLALRLHPDGTFSAGGEDILPTGQYLASAVLSDRQQRRQEFYRRALKPVSTGRPEGPNVLMAWASPIDMHFTLSPEAQTVGDALLVTQLQLERPTAGQRITIPAPLIPCRRILDGHAIRPTFEGSQGIRMSLRFQLPAAVLPFQVEKARFLARIDAPGRRVSVAGSATGPVIHQEESPLDPIRVDIIDAEILGLDAEGGLLLDLAVSETLGGEGKKGPVLSGEKWTIEYLELEVIGKSQ
jgi:hypothetical protein